MKPRTWDNFRLFMIAVVGWVFLSFGLSRAAAAEVTTPLDRMMMKRGYTPVPIKYSRQNWLFANARINGKKVVCLLDTGATDLVVDTRQTGGLKALGKTAAPRYGPLGVVASELPTVWIDRFEVNGVVFTNQEAVAFNLHQSFRAKTGSYIPTSETGESYDVIVGLQMLRSMHAWIDCYGPRLYVRMEKPPAAVLAGIDQSLDASGCRRASVVWHEGTLVVQGTVNGKPAAFFMDTGSFNTVFALDQLSGFDLGNREQIAQMQDVSGRKGDMKYTRVASLKLGEFELKNYPIATVNVESLKKENVKLQKRGIPPLLGMMGDDVLDAAHAFIDCDGGRVFLLP